MSELLIGIDISKWDPILSWKNYTWDFAFIKALEGETPDPVFSAQWRAAQGYTIRGAYHWFHWYNDQAKVVRQLKNLLGSDPGELPPALDLEDDDGEPEKIAPIALSWLSECKKEFGRKPIIYTSWGFANHIKLWNFTEFVEYDLWIAGYPWDTITETWTEEKRQNQIHKIINNPALFPYPTGSPKPFIGKPIFDQWTAKCPPEFVPGYPLGFKKAVDINFCFLTMPQLFERYNITYVPREDDMTDKPVTMTADLIAFQESRLRNSPGTVGTGILQTLTGPAMIMGTGQKIQKDGYWWIEVVAIADMNGKRPISGWIALTTSYTNIQWISPTPTNVTVTKVVTYLSDGRTVETFPKS